MRGSQLEAEGGPAPPSSGKVQPPKAPSRGSTATKVWGLLGELVAAAARQFQTGSPVFSVLRPGGLALWARTP